MTSRFRFSAGCFILLAILLPKVADGLAAPRIGLLWWPADPRNPADTVVESLEECLAEQLAASCPQSTMVPAAAIRNALFPLMEPATQPDSEEAFADLLNRSDIRQRLGKRLDYLIAFTGGTTAEAKGAILCGAGYGGGGCLGFAWINKDTRVSAAVWDLASGEQASHHQSRIEGTTLIPAFILPIPLPARTEGEACRDLTRQIVEFINSRPAERNCR